MIELNEFPVCDIGYPDNKLCGGDYCDSYGHVMLMRSKMESHCAVCGDQLGETEGHDTWHEHLTRIDTRVGRRCSFVVYDSDGGSGVIPPPHISFDNYGNKING